MIYGTPEFDDLLIGIIRDDVRHPMYTESVEHAEAMGVHIDGDKPLYLLQRVRPREDEEVQLYRVENYEPTTKAGADKALTIVKKLFNPVLSSIQWKEQNEEAKELEQYTMKQYPGFNTLQNFNKEVVLQRMIADPNGVIAVKPVDMPEDDTEAPEPECVVYGSSAIYWYDRDCFLICIEPPMKGAYNTEYEKKITARFEYYDKTQYVDFTATYDASDKSIVVQEITLVIHGIGKKPAWFLGGKVKSVANGTRMYLSYFNPALAHWNLAVIHESDLIAAYINHMHPQKYELTDECGYREEIGGMSYFCRGGTIQYPSPGNPSQRAEKGCPQCGGTGQITVKSPFQVYQFNKSKLEEGSPLGIMPAGYIQLEVDATKMLEQRAQKMQELSMWALNMDVEEKVGENQSGVAKTIDRSAQTDTVLEISDRVFEVHLPNQFFFIDAYKNKVRRESAGRANNSVLPEISKPTKIDLLTTAELINNYAVASESGMPKNYLRAKQIEIINRDLSTSPDLKNYLITLIDLDPLYAFDLDEISTAVSAGTIRKQDWAIHNNIKPFVDQAISENRNFLDLPREQKLEKLNDLADELIKSAEPQVKVDAIPPDEDES